MHDVLVSVCWYAITGGVAAALVPWRHHRPLGGSLVASGTERARERPL